MDQTQTPITPIQQHPEEEAHHENGASKMFRKVKAKAKKFKSSITKQDQSHEHDDHDVVEEDDEDDELEPEVISAPVTNKPESLNHPREANVPEPEKVVLPGTKVFPVVSSDYTKPTEPVSLQDTSYGHEVLADPVRTTDTSDKEERREELTDRDGSREAHHEKETGSTVTTKLPISGSGSDLEKKQQGEIEKGVSAKGYLSEKLTPGEEDKALSDMITEKLHLGGGEKKTTTKEVEEGTVEKIPSEKEPEEKEHSEEVAEEAKEVGMVGMIKGWFGSGATEEVKPKSPNSVEESSQSLGSTVGTTGFSDSGKSELRETGGDSGVVPVRSELGN